MIDFNVGSYCSKLAKIDITHYASNFLNWQQQGYNHPTYGGCNWFTDKITYINSLAPTTNTFMLARRKSKIDWCNCMLVQGNCSGAPSPGAGSYSLGCMDDGQRGQDYISNRGTWDFLTQNNTTSSGVVNRPDGTVTPGIHYGSAFPNVPATNYDPIYTIDDGSCKYPIESAPGVQDGLPYHRWGCMNSISDPTGGHPDVNGHGTGAVYRCNTNQTTPQATDPCVYPCAPNQGYIKDNYDPCANFSCWDVPLLPLYAPHSFNSDYTYASDYNICHTFWDNTNASTYNFDGLGSGLNGSYDSPGMWGPFGNEICCTESTPLQSNPDITYDFRLASPDTNGGFRLEGSDTGFAGWQNWNDNQIGHTYLKWFHSRWDVVGNELYLSMVDYNAWMFYGVQYQQGQSTTPARPVNIRIYDIYKNLLADYDYKLNTPGAGSCGAVPGEPLGCWIKSGAYPLIKVSQNYPDPVQFPNHVVDFSMWAGAHTGQSQQFNNSTPQPNFPGIWSQFGQSPVGYVRIDASNYSGTTVDVNNITNPYPIGGGLFAEAPRLASTHWTTPRGNTANLTNHWTGNDFNADINTNPYPGIWDPLNTTTIMAAQNASTGWKFPHSCGFCVTGNLNHPGTLRYHWLEPGPNDPTPGDYFYNNLSYSAGPTSIHPTWLDAITYCSRYTTVPHPFAPGGGVDTTPSSKPYDCEEAIVISTKITYSKNENQEVTIIPSSVDTFTSPPAQATPTPSPTTRTPPPTTPTTPPTFPPDRFSTGRDGY